MVYGYVREDTEGTQRGSLLAAGIQAANIHDATADKDPLPELLNRLLPGDQIVATEPSVISTHLHIFWVVATEVAAKGATLTLLATLQIGHMRRRMLVASNALLVKNVRPVPDRCPKCQSANIRYGGGNAAGCSDCGYYSEDQAVFEVSEQERPEDDYGTEDEQEQRRDDYAARRVGSGHEEYPLNGTSYCGICGDVADLHPESDAARRWHGDTFDPVLIPPADNEARSGARHASAPITADLKIGMYIDCKRCLLEKPADVSPAEWARLSVGWTPKGLQVWCVRHNLNVIHVDFEGRVHPANTTAKP